ncbi:HAMP domain-containing histidine kinase [Helicobacter sp. MIT 05-5293]|nr:HAMP domain-containing histidine kinase [Helicobacter sp. MIT 05-5293]
MSDNSKKAIIKILCLYLGTTSVFLCVFFGFFYVREKQHLFVQQVSNAREVSIEAYEILHTYKDDIPLALRHISDEITQPLRIYDKQGKIIFDNIGIELTPKEVSQGFAKRDNKVIIEPSMHERLPRVSPEPRVSNDKNVQDKDSKENKESKDSKEVKETKTKNKYPLSKTRENLRYKVFIQTDALDSQILFLQFKIFVYLILSITLAGVVAYFLVRFSLKPLQEKIDSLNAFIKDSTHEINTPLSIILMSIETFGTQNLNASQLQKIRRIKLASKSLSHLYKDLVVYNFPHVIDDNPQLIALDVLLSERLEYFAAFFEQKSLHLRASIESSTIVASREKITCVVDNLLNNAIKYNKKGGEVIVNLEQGQLSIADTGCGIAQEHLDKIFDRYHRYNDFQGGFGIGLTLVKRICEQYHIEIDVQSTIDVGSRFCLQWS